MKTKILLSLALSLFCLDGFSRVGLKPYTPKPSNGKTEPAFKANIPLEAARNCSGSCVQAAQETLSPGGVRILNEMPSTERGELMNQLPSVYGELVAYHTTTQPAQVASLQKVASQHVAVREKVRSNTLAIASAVKKSSLNNWPESAKENLAKFIKDLADGVSPAEAEKLEKVRKNCI